MNRPFALASRTLLGLVLLGAACAARAGTLHVYTWASYIDPAVVAEFETEHDATVRFSYFDAEGERDLELAESGGAGFDLILVSGERIAAYGKRGWLAPIDRAAVPNARHIDPRWASAVPGAFEFGVPYLWGSMGLAYRSDLVTVPLESWRDLLDASEELRGRLVMSGDARELVAVALKAAGESANTPARDAIARAGERLLAQRPHVHAYGYPSLGPESSLATGVAVAAMMYSGDVLMMREHTPSLVYTLPEEGGLLWIDYLAVTASSPRKPLAHAFIDFLSRPQIAVRLARHLRYATPNEAAEALLPSAFLADPVIYPSADELERSEFLRPLPSRSRRRVNEIGARLFFR